MNIIKVKPIELVEYKETKALHRAEIKKLRKDIRKHKLLIKQAKNIYKLSKV